MSKVIVIGCATGGLAVIRALRSHPEIEIIAMSHTRSEWGRSSRYNTEVVHCPHPGREEEAFIELLLRKGPSWKGSLLLEAGDYMAVTISKNKDRLRPFYRTSMADWPILQRYMEKSELHALARECGVPCPTTFQAQDLQELERVLAAVQYPCILKPVNSHLFVSRYHVKNFEIANEDELVRGFKRCRGEGFEMVIQEIVPGPDSNLERLQTYVNSQGKLSARFFHNKLRQHPPGFGVMRVGYSTARNPEVEALAERVLAQGGYRGYASIEFKRDQRDGRLKLIEINVRMPLSGMLAVASGVNFPWIIYKDLVENEQVYLEKYVEGLYWIDTLPDLLNMTLNPYGEKRYSLRENLRPYFAPRRVHAVFDWRDLRPFARQLWQGLRRIDRRGRFRDRRQPSPISAPAAEVKGHC